MFDITGNVIILLVLSVQRYGLVLVYVHRQTREICMAAVKENGHALQYVHRQTREICMVAVKENGHALQYVREKTWLRFL